MRREKTREIEIEIRITSQRKVSCSSRTRKKQTTEKKRYLRRSTLKLAQSIGFIIGEIKKAKFSEIHKRLLISL
jgi:hypothetical protein